MDGAAPVKLPKLKLMNKKSKSNFGKDLAWSKHTKKTYN